jgi:hypothetical protein
VSENIQHEANIMNSYTYGELIKRTFNFRLGPSSKHNGKIAEIINKLSGIFLYDVFDFFEGST